MTLYELTVEGLEMEELLTESGGELTPELEARLDAMLLGGKSKIEAAAMVVRGLEASGQACTDESFRLLGRAHSFGEQAARLKSRMVAAVDALGGKVRTDRFTVWAQTSGGTTAMEARDMDALEQAFPEAVKVEKCLRKKVVSELVQRGEDLTPFIDMHEVEGTRFLRIK